MTFIGRICFVGGLALLAAGPALAQTAAMGTAGTSASTSMSSPTATPMSSPSASLLSTPGGSSSNGTSSVPTGGAAPPRVNVSPVLPANSLPVH